MRTRHTVAFILVGALLIALSQPPAFATDEADTAGVSERYVLATRAAVVSLRSNVKDFQLSLIYHGVDTDNSLSIHLSVAPLSPDSPASHRRVRIDKDQAAILIGHLAGDGFLYRGTVNREKQRMRPDEPYYQLVVAADKQEQYVNALPLGVSSYRWHGTSRPPLAQQIDGLRAVLTGEAGNAMDELRETLETPR